MRATCNWNNNNKERRRYVYSSYFVVTTLTVVTLVPWPARTRYNERRRNKEMEIHPRSIQGTLHPRFQKSGKTNNFGASRSSRIGGAGRQAQAKSRRNSTHGCQNRDVLGDRRGHTTTHRNGVVVPRRRIILYRIISHNNDTELTTPNKDSWALHVLCRNTSTWKVRQD